MLFDWLDLGQTLPMNPASAVRGPKHMVGIESWCDAAASTFRPCQPLAAVPPEAEWFVSIQNPNTGRAFCARFSKLPESNQPVIIVFIS